MLWLVQVVDGIFRVDGVRIANPYLVAPGDCLLDGNVPPPDLRLVLDRARASASAEMIRARHAVLLLAGHGAPASA